MKMSICLMMTVAALGCHRLMAQTAVGIEYATEMQTDFRNLNWVHLLRLRFSRTWDKGIRFELGTISIAKTRSERLVNDRQVFSNIEEENLPVSLSVAGWSFNRGASSLFAGLRNLNEDYFTSPVTSFFTNSSCGIFPTIPANYPIANYPLASLGIHYTYRKERWGIQASLYNGRGYDGFTADNFLFRFRPASDGILGIFSSNYQSNDCSYHFGGALHSGSHIGKEQTEERSLSGIFWGYVEQRLTEKLYLLAQYSAAVPSDVWCRMFGGMGMVIRFGRAEAGFFSDCAVFSGEKEYASELACRVTFSDHLSLQPAVHLIQGACGFRIISLIRVNINL